MTLKDVSDRTEDYYKKWVDENKNKIVVIFGEPLIGKTTFVRKILENKDKVIWFKVDTNYKTSDLPNKFNIIDVKHYTILLSKLSELNNYDMKGRWIVVDSITSLSSDFLSDKLMSPRKNIELSNFYDVVFRRLSLLKEKGATIIIIAHEAVKSFQPYEIGPKMNVTVLRHIDKVYRVYKKENGARAIKKWKERVVVNDPKFFIEI